MEIRVLNAGVLAADLIAQAPGVKAATETALVKGARAVEASIKRHASGRPGPQVITGDYRRSWTTEVHRGGDSIVAVVGTNRPQARRLEYGFNGQDSLGRTYHQPPFPHMGPGTDAVEADVYRMIDFALNKGWTW